MAVDSGLSTRTRSVRTEFLPFALPTIEDEEIAAVVEVLRSGWLTSGPRIRRFEELFTAETGAPASLALSSGTAAMHLALTALDLPRGSTVITTPLTFCSTAHVIEHAGLEPLFVDVEPDTLNIDPAAVRAAVETHDEVSAVLPVHYAGHPCDLDDILAVARERGLAVVEDAAHAFGAAHRGTPIGHTGDDERRAVAFSFYATKNITTGEGGMLTGPADLVATSRLWSLHGMSRDSWARYGPRGSWDYEVVVPGFKCNMSDLQAALGIAQLDRWQRMQQRRTEIAAQYDALLGDVDEVELPGRRDTVTHAWHLYPLRLRLPSLAIGRAGFVDELRARNIGTSVHFIPLHTMPYHRERHGLGAGAFPVAEAEFERLVSLPIYPRMTDDDVLDVVTAIRSVVAEHRRAG